MPNRKRPKRRSAAIESLERRTLLTALVVNDTSAVDTITLDVNGSGGISLTFNGQKTDYAQNQWDSVQILNSAGADTINVRATVVPAVVHYNVDNVTVNVGDASGVQNIKASLNMNGVHFGPLADAGAIISVKDDPDTTPRTVSMTRIGDQEIITGLAPAPISIGVQVHPLGPAPDAIAGDTLTLITGQGADTLTIGALRGVLPTSIYNAGGADAINIGAGSLAEIRSDISIAGKPNTSFQPNGATSLTIDDSSDTQPAQFTFSAIYPPGPGAYQYVDFQGMTIPPGRITCKVAEVASLTVNGGAGGNTFTVNDLAGQSASAPVTLNTGAGNDSVLVSHVQGNVALTINGQGGDDSVKTGPIGPFGSQAVNANLIYDGGAGTNSFTVQGPQASPLDIPSFPVVLTAGRIEHNSIAFTYANVAKLTLQNGDFEINGDLGPIALALTSEASTINFESTSAANVNVTQNLKSLSLLDGPMTIMAAGDILLNTDSLSIVKGTLDLTNNVLQVHYAGASDPLASIRKNVFSGNIKTSLADASHGVGYADSADGVVPGLSPSTILVRYTLLGDANLDKRVDFADMVLLAQHYNTAATGNWDQGDFSNNGNIDFNDLAMLAQNYNTSLPMPIQNKVATLAPAKAAIPAVKPASRPFAAKPRPRR